jgi:peptidoglycan/LPS O-acetylase OafA/YrhL
MPSERVARLDGLRGVAILAVIASHVATYAHPIGGFEVAVVRFLAGGWMGVDLFFVLSGYLISTILLGSLGRPNYFRNFYLRRALRIFPLYFALLALLLLVWSRTSLPGARLFDEVRGHQATLWCYAMNFYFPIAGFSPFPLNHLWSLCVEEQFYAVWPAVVRALRGRILEFAVAAAVLAPLLRVALLHTSFAASAPLLASTTRFDGIALGAVVAVLARRTGGATAFVGPARIALALALAILGALFVTQRGLDPLNPRVQWIGYSAAAASSAALLVLVLAASEKSALRRACENRLLRSFGTYSYAIYLFHVPMLVLLHQALFHRPSDSPRFGNSVLPSLGLFFAVACAAAWGAAWVSWRLWEDRWLSLKRFFPSPSEEEGRRAVTSR